MSNAKLHNMHTTLVWYIHSHNTWLIQKRYVIEVQPNIMTGGGEAGVVLN